MRTFYEQWQLFVNRQPVADELPSATESMLQSIEIEGAKVSNELKNDVLKELKKVLLKR